MNSLIHMERYLVYNAFKNILACTKKSLLEDKCLAYTSTVNNINYYVIDTTIKNVRTEEDFKHQILKSFNFAYSHGLYGENLYNC